MAAAVYGGSPRHHNRIIVGVTNTGNTKPAHISPNIALQQSTPFISSSAIQQHQQQQQQIQQQQHHHHHHQQQQQPNSYLTLSQQHSLFMHQSQRHSKRKSAVELLAESKPFYVKSETVLDRHQQLNYRGVSTPYLLSPTRILPTQQQQQQNRPASRRSASSGSDLLQTKLRKLLNTTDSKEAILPDFVSSPKYASESPSSKYNSFQYHTPKINQELSVLPDPQCDSLFSFAFLSPQSLPPHPVSDDDLYSYGIDDGLLLTDDYCTISPPAEYAEDNLSERNGANRYSYQRSYSHTQTVTKTPEDYSPSYNINSHKSLPDLHSQISRHSPHSEVLSCCSRGNRSNKSGSSFNRDSGGSSGHYTHRSEPCCKQKEQPPVPPSPAIGSDFRRDSGSSTQHSGNSYFNYGSGIPPFRYDCVECKAKIQKDADCLLNFTTPEVPEAFQDDYDGNSKRYYEDSKKYYNSRKCDASKTVITQEPQSPQAQELSPPLGTFKRQKCLRFKQRGKYSTSNQREDDRRPILRSKSDISDRYCNRIVPFAETKITSNDKRVKSESMSQLERFFERLGLDDETYDEFVAPKEIINSDEDSDHSSPVFFSDVSTVDSNRLPDSTETQNNQTNSNSAMYRPSEPPSIIERNARIIKWLCNCKKVQLA